MTLIGNTFGVDPSLNCAKPFVATGSRPSNSAYSLDGPSNFYDAGHTDFQTEARESSAPITMNDLVSAFYATKTNGNTASTFLALDQGYIAQFMLVQPYFFLVSITA
ncbi:hypothetical protein DER46DRAFT_575834 [Fusarium sp. MPI-SDFR-AT-0072]|nr:hypothetical protein DER46DRAFT_575834 [Fusarium sp. MPI-SDFR-AT-0072]